MSTKQSRILVTLVFGVGVLTSCFRPIVYLKNSPNYPVDVFYADQRPERPFEPLQDLESKGNVILKNSQTINRRMLSRGNNMQEKEMLLARMTLEAKKLGADALVDVRYKYYTSMTDNGYVMTGLAVKYKKEN